MARQGFTVRLPHDRRAADTARQLVKALLVERDASPRLLADAAIVVHELVINSVTHGRPDPNNEIELSCRLSSDELLISVLDQGRSGTVVVQPPSTTRLSGRGLAIVAGLSRAWTVDRTDGTRVSARLAV